MAQEIAAAEKAAAAYAHQRPVGEAVAYAHHVHISREATRRVALWRAPGGIRVRLPFHLVHLEFRLRGEVAPGSSSPLGGLFRVKGVKQDQNGAEP